MASSARAEGKYQLAIGIKSSPSLNDSLTRPLTRSLTVTLSDTHATLAAALPHSIPFAFFRSKRMRRENAMLWALETVPPLSTSTRQVPRWFAFKCACKLSLQRATILSKARIASLLQCLRVLPVPGGTIHKPECRGHFRPSEVA